MAVHTTARSFVLLLHCRCTNLAVPREIKSSSLLPSPHGRSSSHHHHHQVSKTRGHYSWAKQPKRQDNNKTITVLQKPLYASCHAVVGSGLVGVSAGCRKVFCCCSRTTCKVDRSRGKRPICMYVCMYGHHIL